MLKPLQTLSILFHRFSFLFVYFSQIIQCWNTCLLFFSLPSFFYFCIDSLHAYIYFQFNTENKERKGILFTRAKNGQTIPDHFKRLSNNSSRRDNKFTQRNGRESSILLARFQKSPRWNRQDPQVQRRRLKRWRWKKRRVEASRVPIEGADAPNCRPNGKRARQDKSGGRLILNRYQVPGGFRCLRRDTFPRSSFGWSRRGEEGTQRPTVTDCVMRSYPTGRSRLLAGTVAGMVSLGTCSANKLPFVLET